MTISSLIPTLQPMVEQVNGQLRFICFFILTIAMIVRTGTGSTDLPHLVRPLVTNAIICAFIATLPTWFNMIRDSFWAIAVQIQQDFTGSVDGTGTKLMQALQPPDCQINWLDVSGSIWRAVQYALAWVIVWIGAIIQLPMMFFQYIMECLCYLFLPIAVSLFAFDGTKGLAIRYVQQTMAILAWPIGFAVVDMVGDALLNSIASAFSIGAVALGAATEFGPATLVVAGFVAVWLILGSLAVPVVMQALFCSGSPMSSAVGHALQYGLALAGMARMGEEENHLLRHLPPTLREATRPPHRQPHRHREEEAPSPRPIRPRRRCPHSPVPFNALPCPHRHPPRWRRSPPDPILPRPPLLPL